MRNYFLVFLFFVWIYSISAQEVIQAPGCYYDSKLLTCVGSCNKENFECRLISQTPYPRCECSCRLTEQSCARINKVLDLEKCQCVCPAQQKEFCIKTNGRWNEEDCSCTYYYESKCRLPKNSSSEYTIIIEAAGIGIGNPQSPYKTKYERINCINECPADYYCDVKDCVCKKNETTNLNDTNKNQTNNTNQTDDGEKKKEKRVFSCSLNPTVYEEEFLACIDDCEKVLGEPSFCVVENIVEKNETKTKCRCVSKNINCTFISGTDTEGKPISCFGRCPGKKICLPIEGIARTYTTSSAEEDTSSPYWGNPVYSCKCACPEIKNCPPNFVFNEETCECECKEDRICLRPYVFDKEKCDCVCPPEERKDCPPEYWNEKTCQCEAKYCYEQIIPEKPKDPIDEFITRFSKLLLPLPIIGDLFNPLVPISPIKPSLPREKICIPDCKDPNLVCDIVSCTCIPKEEETYYSCSGTQKSNNPKYKCLDDCKEIDKNMECVYEGGNCYCMNKTKNETNKTITYYSCSGRLSGKDPQLHCLDDCKEIDKNMECVYEGGNCYCMNKTKNETNKTITYYSCSGRLSGKDPQLHCLDDCKEIDKNMECVYEGGNCYCMNKT
ncbi:MAG: hypothetical protein N3D10_00820, partial [Candidatus Micrarchaeota archaeon]|nr:hypothetical protein [Candidatus Micrarchaeota archaeon]